MPVFLAHGLLDSSSFQLHRLNRKRDPDRHRVKGFLSCVAQDQSNEETSATRVGQKLVASISSVNNHEWQEPRSPPARGRRSTSRLNSREDGMLNNQPGSSTLCNIRSQIDSVDHRRVWTSFLSMSAILACSRRQKTDLCYNFLRSPVWSLNSLISSSQMGI